VNFIEKLLFRPKNVIVRALLGRNKISGDAKAYFKEFFDFYKPIRIMAYDEREILCEKVRAILTRRAQKLRDFYDLFILSEHGFKVEDQRKEIIEKIRGSPYYKKYRDNLESNRKGLEVDMKISEDPKFPAVKSTSQSLGRALRSKQERAVFVLGDKRYERFIGLLPDFVQRDVKKIKSDRETLNGEVKDIWG